MAGPARAGLFVYANDMAGVAAFYEAVAGIAATGALVQRLGGVLYAEQWQGPGFLVNNACDPEGNVFQVREFQG
jgi:predicted enzyme related to lactoylglutathione lyase